MTCFLVLTSSPPRTSVPSRDSRLAGNNARRRVRRKRRSGAGKTRSIIEIDGSAIRAPENYSLAAGRNAEILYRARREDTRVHVRARPRNARTRVGTN